MPKYTLVRWFTLLALFMGLTLSVGSSAQEFAVPTDPVAPEAWQVRSLPTGWTRLAGPAFEIYGHLDDLAVLERMSDHGTQALPALARDLGVPIGGVIRVYVADTPEAFRDLQPGDPPKWADGTAWPSLGVIFLRAPMLRGGTSKPLEQVLDHELVHILLGRAFAPAPTPAWLQEGVAQVYSGEVGPDLPQRLARGMMGRVPYNLEQLTQRFPTGRHGADLAYAQSADFIQWFRGEYGDVGVRDLIRQTAAGRPFPSVIKDLTGERLDDLDDEWRERLVASTPIWTSPDVLVNSLWGFGGVLLIVGGFARRRAFRRRMIEWREEDQGLERLARAMLRRRV